MGYGSVNVGYPIKPETFEQAGAVEQHNADPNAHPEMRAEMLTAQIQVSYNEGVS